MKKAIAWGATCLQEVTWHKRWPSSYWKLQTWFHSAVWHPLTVHLLMLLLAQNCGHKFYRADIVKGSTVYFLRGTLHKRFLKGNKEAFFFSYILFAGFLWHLLYSCTRPMTAFGSLWICSQEMSFVSQTSSYMKNCTARQHT